MANETVLSSTHALPSKLLSSGYPFRYRNLQDALYQALAMEKVEP
jgi:NAD dependent epimerase/dehydratase family enzyme